MTCRQLARGSWHSCASCLWQLLDFPPDLQRVVLARWLPLGMTMQIRALLLVGSFGLVAQPITACSGRATEASVASAGASGSEEAAGSGNASGSGASSGAGASGGSSPEGGSAGTVALAGAGGATPREPTKHRPTATTCDHTRASNDPGAPTDPDGPRVECRAHTDCTDGENGRCVGNGHDGWRCTYDSCFADSDCSDGTSGPQLCECEGGSRSDNNVCLRGTCRVDADCGAAGYCSPSFGDCGNYFGVIGYYCHTNTDECVNDADCNADGSHPEAYCAFKPTVGRWQCSNLNCVG